MLFSCFYGEADRRRPACHGDWHALPLRLAIVVGHVFIAAGESD